MSRKYLTATRTRGVCAFFAALFMCVAHINVAMAKGGHTTTVRVRVAQGSHLSGHKSHLTNQPTSGAAYFTN